MARKRTEFNFEKSLTELEELVEKMERGEYSLEEALKQFERGIGLVRGCQQALAEAEQKVQLLVAKNGAEKLEPFDADAAVEGD